MIDFIIKLNARTFLSQIIVSLFSLNFRAGESKAESPSRVGKVIRDRRVICIPILLQLIEGKKEEKMKDIHVTLVEMMKDDEFVKSVRACETDK